MAKADTIISWAVVTMKSIDTEYLELVQLRKKLRWQSAVYLCLMVAFVVIGVTIDPRFSLLAVLCMAAHAFWSIKQDCIRYRVSELAGKASMVRQIVEMLEVEHA